MLTRRIVPCLDVRDGHVVKGVRFREHAVMGDIVDFARKYRDDGADDLVFYDITARPQQQHENTTKNASVARELDVPFCVAGGIRSVDDARAILMAGADKISVNSPALEQPDLVDALAQEFGTQCVVVGIDSLRDDDGVWRVRQYSGDPDKTRAPGRETLQWIKEVQERGAGEIVLNCMGSDGVRAGFDIEQLRAARAVCDVPLVASGGAGAAAHFCDVFEQADVDAALAASVFHTGALLVSDLKRELAAYGMPVRR